MHAENDHDHIGDARGRRERLGGFAHDRMHSLEQVIVRLTSRCLHRSPLVHIMSTSRNDRIRWALDRIKKKTRRDRCAVLHGRSCVRVRAREVQSDDDAHRRYM